MHKVIRSAVIGLCCAVVLTACAGESARDALDGASASAAPPATSEGTPAASDSPEGGGEVEAPADGSDSDVQSDPDVRGGDGPTILPSAPLDRPTFPVVLDPTGDHLVDADGDPFLIHGDAGWSMIIQLDAGETAQYLQTRREQGFNLLVVNLIEHQFGSDAPRDEAGRAPFSSPGDFANPNDDYFDAARAQIQQAADEGFVVLLAPAYLGFDGGEEGWYADMLAAGEATMRDYGRYVGERFGDLDNIIWLHAGDYSPPPEGLRLVEAVDAGLRDAGADQLRTAHGTPGDSATDLGLQIPLDLDATYTYGLTHLASREDHTDSHPQPHFLFETNYEDDGRGVSRQDLRAQAYGSLLSGAIGQVYGNGPVWQFDSRWPEGVVAIGAEDQRHVRALFERLPWTSLEPDLDASLVVEGSGNYEQPDFAVAASTPDRRTAVVYLPRLRTIGLELGQDPSGATVSWYDPTTGTTAEADVERTATGIRATPPGTNAAGGSDWVLLVDLGGGDDVAVEATRLQGSDRVGTSVAVSQAVLDRSAVAVLVSAEDFPDALVSAPLAVTEGAALLLTGRTAVPSATLAEMDRLEVDRVVVLGGPAVVGEQVLDTLRARGLQVERVDGPDRIATAVAVASRFGADPAEVVLASGFAFPDGLAGAALAAALRAPMLLTDGESLDEATAEVIGDADVVVVGGSAVVGETVLDALRDQGAAVTRLGGDGRYDTAALAAAEVARRTGAPERVWVATGRDFPDALSSAAGAVRDQAVVLLTEGLAGAVPGATAAALGDLGACASSLRLVGGTAAISGGHASALLGVVGC